MTALAGGVAVAAGVFFAFASALQHRAAGRESPRRSADPWLVLRLLQRPVWLAGTLSGAAGLALQTLALRLGPLALVQPVMASGLFLSVLLEAALERRRPRRGDLAAVALAGSALAAFLLAAAPRSGIAQPSGRAWAWVAVAVTPLVGWCLALARHSAAARRATYLGLATGVVYGVSAALLKACADRLAADPLALLADWRLYTLAVVGAAGITLNQSAFQNGALAAPLTALTLAEPVVALALGVTAFHERLATAGPRLIVLAVAATAMARGVWLASAAHATASSSAPRRG